MVEWRGRQVAHVWLTDRLMPEPKNTTGIVAEQRTEFKKCPLCSRDWRSPIFLIFSLLSFCLLICQFVQKDTHCYCFPSPCIEILSLLSVLGTALTNLKSNNNITATTARWLVLHWNGLQDQWREEVVKLFCRKHVQTLTGTEVWQTVQTNTHTSPR